MNFQNCVTLPYLIHKQYEITRGLQASQYKCSILVGAQDFVFSNTSRLALWPTHPATQWVQGAPSLGVNLPGYEVDYSSPSSVNVKNKWMCILLLLHALLLLFTINPLKMGADMRSQVCWSSSSMVASRQQSL